MINYKLIRSKRKTIGIYITKNAKVEVRAPLKAPQSLIDEFVNSKEEWINNHLSKRAIINKTRTEFTLNYGSSILLQGNEYIIKAHENNTVKFDGKYFYIPQNMTGEEIKQTVIHLYKLIAKNILEQKTDYFSKIIGVTPVSIKINNAKTHWGSCSGKNRINFSWKLILANDDVIDYVVVHELAHIIEHNHSERFWKIVKNIVPDYKLKRMALKSLQERIYNESWE